MQEQPIPKKLNRKEAQALLDHFYAVLGPQTVLLILPYATKELKGNSWEKITFERTQTSDYRGKLRKAIMRGGNLAVRLGPLSGGLRAIDIDLKDRIPEFLELNPTLKSTATVYGRRGCQFFFRLSPDSSFPHKNEAWDLIKTNDGQDYGEWRYGETGGAYSMIYGQHPLDPAIIYRLEGEEVVQIEFEQLRWPSDLDLPWLSKSKSDSRQSDKPIPSGTVPEELEHRIKAYLEACPPSIAHHGGDTQLFKVACLITNGFALSLDQCVEMLARYFNPRCLPPWNEDRLWHKASEAQKVEHEKPRGHFLARPPEYPAEAERPTYRFYLDFWNSDKRLRAPGTYHHTVEKEKDKVILVDLWICSPLEVLAITSTREDHEYGKLVQFTSQKGRLKQWAIPSRWFGGRGDEVLSELLALGLSINHKERTEIVDYLAMARPAKHLGSTLGTGWYDEHTFVLPDLVIGTSDVWYQGGPVSASPYGQSGTLEAWQEEVAKRAIGNPNLIVAISAALAGPLLRKFNVEGGGLHWFGPTTTGKTTSLECAQSVWGGSSYRRTWRSTVNALEGAALLHTDTVLVVDEIHQVNALELDSAIYALINGYGKGRADKLGGTKPVAHWRVMVLSSGEVSSEVQLAQGGINVRAGQILRFLDIPISGDFGAFDSLHGLTGGAVFADTLREAASAHYGHAGPLFVRRLIDSGEDLREDLALVTGDFETENNMQRRVARIFSIVALAGETAAVWGVVPWPADTAREAACLLFGRWQEQVAASAGAAPQKKILSVVATFIDSFGDSCFSDLDETGDSKVPVRDRAGYWQDETLPDQPKRTGTSFGAINPMPETRRIYLFTKTGLQKAAKGYDLNQVTRALDEAGALTKKDSKHYTKLTRTPHGTERLYYVDRAKLD